MDKNSQPPTADETAPRRTQVSAQAARELAGLDYVLMAAVGVAISIVLLLGGGNPRADTPNTDTELTAAC